MATETTGTRTDAHPTEEELVEKYIEQHPNKWGRQHAVLIEDAYPVWAIIGSLIGRKWDVRLTAEDYALSEDQVRAAIGYYRRNKPYIDGRLTNIGDATLPERVPDV